MTEANEAQRILESVDAIKQGHFVLASGRHSEFYVSKDAIYSHPYKVAALCRKMALNFYKKFPEVVLAPALGGIALSQWTASSLSYLLKYEVLALYAEKICNPPDYILSRGYSQLLQNKRVLIVDDVLTTGSTINRIIKIAKAHYTTIVGVSVICSRSNKQTSLLELDSLDCKALINLPFESWMADNCPLCEMNIPINIEYGRGIEFLARFQQKR